LFSFSYVKGKRAAVDSAALLVLLVKLRLLGGRTCHRVCFQSDGLLRGLGFFLRDGSRLAGRRTYNTLSLPVNGAFLRLSFLHGRIAEGFGGIDGGRGNTLSLPVNGAFLRLGFLHGGNTPGDGRDWGYCSGRQGLVGGCFRLRGVRRRDGFFHDYPDPGVSMDLLRYKGGLGHGQHHDQRHQNLYNSSHVFSSVGDHRAGIPVSKFRYFLYI
jgi:hypothetical protein